MSYICTCISLSIINSSHAGRSNRWDNANYERLYSTSVFFASACRFTPFACCSLKAGIIQTDVCLCVATGAAFAACCSNFYRPSKQRESNATTPMNARKPPCHQSFQSRGDTASDSSGFGGVRQRLRQHNVRGNWNLSLSPPLFLA